MPRKKKHVREYDPPKDPYAYRRKSFLTPTQQPRRTYWRSAGVLATGTNDGRLLNKRKYTGFLVKPDFMMRGYTLMLLEEAAHRMGASRTWCLERALEKAFGEFAEWTWEMDVQEAPFPTDDQLDTEKADKSKEGIDKRVILPAWCEYWKKKAEEARNRKDDWVELWQENLDDSGCKVMYLSKKSPNAPKANGKAEKNAVAPENGKFVLAYGEATGHLHAVEAIPGVALYDMGDGSRMLVNETDGTIALTHQEHATQHFAPGAYKVTIQREYDPIEARRVQD